MNKMTYVNAIMTTNVISVAPNDTMDKVHSIFQKDNIHHLPVTENGKIVGILSYSDYLRLQNSFTLFNTLRSEVTNLVLMKSLLVKEVMTKQVAKVQPNDTIEVAAGYFRENRFHALPVVDSDGTLVGILTTYDLLNYAFSDN
ncbi:MAG: CBS domain-containing protein [Saprospiraceae bacterium]|nr:CBS domain-containing protein [Saprospiraceae bacterium]